MNHVRLLPSKFCAPLLLEQRPVATTSPRLKRKIPLGTPGRCPKVPTLTIMIADDSGSLYGPVGNDPLSNRYAEARQAIRTVSWGCNCGTCIAAIIHFDAPTSGCVEPRPFSRAGLRQLLAGLAVPTDAAGASALGPSLGKAESLAAANPDHQPVLIILTDWQLFDDDIEELMHRLGTFPGLVYAVALRIDPPPGMLDSTINVVTITAASPPGSLARAVFDGLTAHRFGRKLA